MYDIKRLECAHSVHEALDLYKTYPESRIIAGGTDVMIHLKNRKWKEVSLISIGSIPELKEISIDESGDLLIGAGIDFTSLCENELILKYVPILAEACDQVGSPQIRNVATIGGNICNGAVSADSVPSLYALDAKLILESADGVREVEICGFHTGPGKTVLKAGEILTKIRIPKASYEGFGGAYIKFGMRNAMEIATLSCAACVKLTDAETVEDVRMAFGVAAPTPVRVRALESALTGRKIDEELYSYIEEHAIDELHPRDSWRASLVFRTQLIKTLSVRAFKAAVDRAAAGKE